MGVAKLAEAANRLEAMPQGKALKPLEAKKLPAVIRSAPAAAPAAAPPAAARTSLGNTLPAAKAPPAAKKKKKKKSSGLNASAAAWSPSATS